MQHQIAPARSRRVRAGLVGSGIAASRTPAMHMAEGRALGLDYDYALLDSDHDPAPLPEILDRARRAGFAGLNVTFPYKVEIVPLLDGLSDTARALGAVNTVVFRDGQAHGHNTDMWGFAESFRRGMAGASTRKVLLLGAGGAGMAVAHALMSLGTRELWLFDSDMARARGLADALGQRFGGGRVHVARDLSQTPADLSGVVNATPMGMQKLPGCPFPTARLHRDLWVADIVYFPLETALLAAARAVGARVLPGSGMAVFQAVRAFELITGLVPDAARMRAIFQSLGP